MNIELPPVGEIKSFFPNHRICVVKNFILLVQCIFKSRTVCLYKCRAEVGPVLGRKDIKLKTAYMRLLRFFKIKHIDIFCTGIIKFIIHLVDFRGEVYMSIDRTNWKIGAININVLYIGLILPNGIFIPILWELFNKRGNSSEQERCELIGRFFKVWQFHSDIEITMLGDREFIGIDWFGFMKRVDFSFVIRARWQDYWKQVSISNNILISNIEKKITRSIKKKGYFQTTIILKGELLYYTVFENSSKRQGKNDKWLVLISDKKDIDWLRISFPKRWSIEVFFFHVKTNGFNLEDLNLTNLLKAQLMMGITAFCYVLSIINGIKHQETEKIEMKIYNGRESRAISIFRLGYDNLKNSVHVVKDLIAFIRKQLPEIPIWKAMLWKVNLKSV